MPNDSPYLVSMFRLYFQFGPTTGGATFPTLFVVLNCEMVGDTSSLPHLVSGYSVLPLFHPRLLLLEVARQDRWGWQECHAVLNTRRPHVILCHLCFLPPSSSLSARVDIDVKPPTSPFFSFIYTSIPLSFSTRAMYKRGPSKRAVAPSTWVL